MLPIEIGHWNVPVAAPIQVVNLSDPPVDSVKSGEEVGAAPACLAALCPVVEIVGVTAVDDHAVDRAGPANSAGEPDDDGASIDVRRRLGLELPSVGFIEHDFDEA